MPEDNDISIYEQDTNLLMAILAEPIGVIANIIQAASELPGDDLCDRLSMAYYELTNKDPGAETDMIQLKPDPEED